MGHPSTEGMRRAGEAMHRHAEKAVHAPKGQVPCPTTGEDAQRMGDRRKGRDA